jgi:hypothetical protein
MTWKIHPTPEATEWRDDALTSMRHILMLDEAGAIVRPWLTVIIDDHSRAVAAYQTRSAPFAMTTCSLIAGRRAAPAVATPKERRNATSIIRFSRAGNAYPALMAAII